MHHSRPRSRAFSFALAIMLCVALVPVIPAGAIIEPTTWYVDAVNGDDANTGASATDAFQHIQTALNEGEPYDIVVLLPGTYDDNGEDWPVNVTYPVTIQSQDGAETTFVGDEGGHPLFDIISGPTLIEGITFRNGVNGSGGAITSRGADLDVADCVFTGNTAEVGGAIAFDAMLISGVVPSFEEDSIAVGLGLFGCVFEGNGNETTDTPFGAEALLPTCYEGGAVYAYGGALDIEGCEFRENGAEYYGPAVMAGYAEAMVTDSVFEGNQVTMWSHGEPAAVGATFDKSAVDAHAIGTRQIGFDMDAGALAVAYSTVDVSNTEFVDNFAYNGAGMSVVNSYFEVSDSLFSGNYTSTGAFSALESEMTDNVVGPLPDSVTPQILLPEETSIFERTVVTGTRGGMAAMSLPPMGTTQVRNSVFYGNGYYLESDLPGDVPPDEIRPLEAVIFVGGDEIGPPPPAPSPEGVTPQGAPPVSIDNCTIADNDANFGIASPYSYASAANTIVWQGEDDFSIGGVDPYRCDLFPEPEELEGTAVEPQPMQPWFSEDPDFVDPENGDYSINPWSSCVDTGTDLMGIVDDDFDGTSRPKDGNEDGESVYDVGAYEVDPWSDTRLGGDDRYGTSVTISQRHFPFGADTVVLATGRKFADGLSGSGLAGVYNAPMLLTEPDMLPEVVFDEIDRLGATHVVVLGGVHAIADDVIDSLPPMVEEVERIGGVDRYETAAMIADEILELEGDGFGGMFFIARGDLFADALTASPVAWANKVPILLVQPDELPPATIDVIEAAAGSSAIVLGGDAAVSSRVAGQVDAMVDATDRVSGTDRYDTSANFSEWAVDGGFASWDAVGVATGERFPDALSGGPGIGSHGGVVLLTPTLTMNESIESILTDNGDAVTSLEVFGGEAAVSAEVYDALMALVADI